MSIRSLTSATARHAAVAGLAVLAALLAGCGDNGGGTASTGVTAKTTPTATTAPAVTATTPEGIDVMKGAGTAPVVVAAANTDTALLTAVRAARHEGFDRLVFEFRNAVPGYDVRYVRPPLRQDGSGKAVRVAGAFVVRVRMENALDADLSQAAAPRTYTGPSRIAHPTPELAELARVGGFEGVLTWAVGLRDRVDFRVSTLAGPPRLVVDFRNH